MSICRREAPVVRRGPSRREFLSLSAAMAVGAVTTACAGITSTLAPTPSPVTPTPVSAAIPMKEEVPKMSRVALIRTSDRVEGVRRALALLGADGPAGKRVLLKPNFNSADPTPGSTHNDVLRALVAWLREAGASSIVVADRSGMGDTRRVMEQKGIFELSRELDFEVQVLDELDADGWELIRLPDSHWRDGFPMAKLALETPYILQTCCLKTHRYGGHFTLSLKNSVGLVAKYLPGKGYNYMNELHTSPYQRLMIAEINAAYTPDLIILDGVEAFVKGGPDRGERVQANVVLAGTDRLAIDAVGVAILRHFGTTPEVSRGRVFEQEQIARAVELGLGAQGPDQIEILTDDEEGAAFAGQIRAILAA
ncbi:MAG TPA: DUF362 domain-containing protein [Caldilineae bacterium]|nr:DUF362 domain-containing protein [Caldilineae bacterium]